MGFALKKTDLPHYTYQDYLQWEGKWELIDGIPYSMSPAPNLKHQKINTNIIIQLENKLRNCSGCEVYMPIDWKTTEFTVVQPDVSVVCGKSQNDNYLDFPPTVIFEILSPSTSKKDREIKFNLYQSEGVAYYVIVNPETKNVEIFQNNNFQYQKAKETHSESFVFNIKNCIVDFDFSKIWN